MAFLLKYCFKSSRANSAYCTSEQALMGVPLRGYEGDGVAITGPAAWSWGIAYEWQRRPQQHTMASDDGVSADAQPSAPPEEADSMETDWEESYNATYDWKSGGMWMTAKSYRTSFYTQGLKWYDINEPHGLKVAFSTVDSNRRSGMVMGMPFLSFTVWTSAADGHTKAEGGGMETTPGGIGEATEVFETSVAEYFKPLNMPWQDFEGLEGVLHACGIHEYTRFICGYHIGGIAAKNYDANLCGLDWYAQTTTMRQHNPDIWQRYVITDQVCPTQCVFAKSFEYLGQYEGWHGHQTGKA